MSLRWQDILDQVRKFREPIFESKRAEPFYRGHADANWKLQPSLFRCCDDHADPQRVFICECRLYWGLIQRGAHLLPRSPSPWETLYTMQHYGLPTRLLDWSRNFATALWFAISEYIPGKVPCVWMLDQYRLNELESGNSAVYLPDYDFISDYGHSVVGYEPYVLDYDRKTFASFPWRIAAIAGVASIPRVRSQSGVFTLHRDANFYAENDSLFRGSFLKIEIPEYLVPEAKAFLAISGTDSFSIYPDLHGLSAYLKKAVTQAVVPDLL